MAGKKEAKQKAGPSGQKEKNRKETEDLTGAKGISEDAGQRPAQDMQKREAHKDLKDRGELKKPSMTKSRQARKVATMVKRLKKNPEDGESQPPIEGEADLASGDGWDAQQQATVTAYAQSRGCNLGRCCKLLSTRWRRPCAKRKKETRLVRLPHPAPSRKGRQRAKLKLDPAPEEGEGTRGRKNRMATASHATDIREEVYLRKPGGRKSRKKGPEAWGPRARRT